MILSLHCLLFRQRTSRHLNWICLLRKYQRNRLLREYQKEYLNRLIWDVLQHYTLETKRLQFYNIEFAYLTTRIIKYLNFFKITRCIFYQKVKIEPIMNRICLLKVICFKKYQNLNGKIYEFLFS